MKTIVTGCTKYGTTSDLAEDAQERATTYVADQLKTIKNGLATRAEKQDAIEILKSMERFGNDYEDIDIYIPKRAIQAIRKNAKKIIEL